MLDAAPPPLVEAVDQKRLVIPPPVVPAEAVQQSVVVGDGVILDRWRRFGVGVVGGRGLGPAHDHVVVRHVGLLTFERRRGVVRVLGTSNVCPRKLAAHHGHGIRRREKDMNMN